MLRLYLMNKEQLRQVWLLLVISWGTQSGNKFYYSGDMLSIDGHAVVKVGFKLSPSCVCSPK